MSKPSGSAAAGIWLTIGGLLVLIAHHVIGLDDQVLSLDSVTLTAGAVAGYILVALGVFELSRSRATYGPFPPLKDRGVATRFALSGAGPDTSEMALRCAAVIRAWLEELSSESDAWQSFDQLVREQTAEHLDAARTRCYHIRDGGTRLQRLSGDPSWAAADGAGARDGIIGHVITTGRAYCSADPTHGELIDRLAAEDEQSWDLIWPIRSQAQTIGIIAIARVEPDKLRDAGRWQTLQALLTTLWLHLICRAELRVARSTDRASGVLTRADFFASAQRILDESYANNEPVVAAAVALEGLRGMDDAGRWKRRDRLIERVGGRLAARLRTDDLVGRFADDRFVILLRCVDIGLGRLISKKLIADAQAVIEEGDMSRDGVHIRAGITGGGPERVPLDTLLVSAFEAVAAARDAGDDVRSDAAPTGILAEDA